MKYPLLLVMLLFTATSAYSVCNTYPVFGDHCLRQVKVGTEQTIFGIGSHYQLYRNGEPYGSEREGDGDVLIWTVNNPGVYTVRNTYCNIMMSGQFSIASIEASPIACPGGTANLTVNNATNGMTYQLISLSRGPLGTETAVGPTVHFTFVSTTNDTYQVMTGGCLITFPSSLTIGGQSPQPTTATIDVCLPGLRVSNPQGTTFSVYINDVFITSASGSIDVPISVSGSGVYRIDTRTSSNCFFSTILGTLNIDPTPKPIKYNVSLTSGNIYSCVGSTMTKKIGLSDSDVGVNYQLRADESISVQAPKAGTGNAIEWIIDTSQGSQFTVAATRIANGCVEIMNGNVTLQSIDPPEIRTVEVDLCAGKIWVNCPDPNVEYQLYKNGVAEQAPQRQVGYCSTPVQWTGLGSGLYTIKGTNVITTCSSIMANSINVPVNSVPRLFTVSGGGSGCSTGAFNVILSGSDPEVQYTLKDNFNHSLVSKMGNGYCITS